MVEDPDEPSAGAYQCRHKYPEQEKNEETARHTVAQECSFPGDTLRVKVSKKQEIQISDIFAMFDQIK